MVLRNFLDENVCFLQVAIVLTCFQSEKSQNKLDRIQTCSLKRFTKLVKINFWGSKPKKSHLSNFTFSLCLNLNQGTNLNLATGVASKQGTLTLPDTWFRPPFWDLLMLQLLRPNSSNLPCLYSTFHLEYPLVLSRFCLSRLSASKILRKALKLPRKHAIMNILSVQI